MDYRVIYDTELSAIEVSRQLPLEVLTVALAVLFVATVLGFLLTRRRIKRLEVKVTLLESNVSRINYNVAELASEFSKLNLKFVVPKRASKREKKLTEFEVEKLAELIISKAPVKINREKLKELIMKRDLKALAKALKMSISEVEILMSSFNSKA